MEASTYGLVGVSPESVSNLPLHACCNLYDVYAGSACCSTLALPLCQLLSLQRLKGSQLPLPHAQGQT